MSNPMEQFNIKTIIPIHIGNYDISFTNSSLFMLLAVAACLALFTLCLRKRTIVPEKGQAFAEMVYGFVHGLVKNNVGAEGLKYFSFIFSLFLFVAFGNVLGLFPYAFTFTSHVAAVGTLSLLALLFNVVIGIKKKKWGYIRTIMPKGIPWALAPLVMPIETISLLSKPFSLTIRLVANMTVGHIMLKIIAGFIVALGVAGVVPLLFDAVIIVFELFIALLQAFIYTVLSCIYLSDAIHSH
ncbi:MAG: F0F1 ATP synthase subunit A [Rhodospirillales bacterium]|nr:F0F1 ATP synthase subunit A [Rhodospirillales bacterium]